MTDFLSAEENRDVHIQQQVFDIIDEVDPTAAPRGPYKKQKKKKSDWKPKYL